MFWAFVAGYTPTISTSISFSTLARSDSYWTRSSEDDWKTDDDRDSLFSWLPVEGIEIAIDAGEQLRLAVGEGGVAGLLEVGRGMFAIACSRIRGSQRVNDGVFSSRGPALFENCSIASEYFC